ncbi:MAG: hypothetical protein ACKV1O_12860 [Saprospiraceae bacterium]
MSNFPPEYLQPCLFSIEQAVVVTYQQYPQLFDKEVEETYELFKDFYQQLAKGKELYEPSSTKVAKQALIEAILEALDAREEIGADESYILNDHILAGGDLIHSLEDLYAMCFKYLIRSARFWRKEGGRMGYLKFISSQLPG